MLAFEIKKSHNLSKDLLTNYIKLDICVLRTRMSPPSALSKMALWLRYWFLSDNYRSIKADLYNIVETNEGPCRSKRLAFSLQPNLGYEYETNMLSSLPIHSIC